MNQLILVYLALLSGEHVPSSFGLFIANFAIFSEFN
jgi:hypothetical protein